MLTMAYTPSFISEASPGPKPVNQLQACTRKYVNQVFLKSFI